MMARKRPHSKSLVDQALADMGKDMIPGEVFIRTTIKYRSTSGAYYSGENSKMRWCWWVEEVTPYAHRESTNTLAQGRSRIKFFALWRAKKAARLIGDEIVFVSGGDVASRIARLEKELNIGS